MSRIHDVIQIGYGPVSQALALMLGRQGRSVVVCERWKTRYPLPRAVCIDHELYRVLSALGLGEVLPAISQPGPLYQWFNADWRELLTIDWSAPSISGGAEVNFVHEPTLEEALDRAVNSQPTVELRLGVEAIEIRQACDLVHVALRDVETGEISRVSGRYVIGCDGANSIVRRSIGGEPEDRGFEADWLVIDALLADGETIESLGIPAAAQYCNPSRPTTIVPAGVREGRVFRRWEFMRLPGEAPEDLEREEVMWSLLKPWARPGDLEIVRCKIYNFRSLLAARWRDRRVLIAGDAAHVMPPFMGQGMCSGLRDAWNLAWKLSLILDGHMDDGLLNTYQAERMAHVSAVIDASIFLGQIICIPDPAAAALRDERFLSGQVDPPAPFPGLTDGLVRRDPDGAPEPGAGLLSPHVCVESGGESGRLDDILGVGFRILALDAEPEDLIEVEVSTALASFGARLVMIRTADGAGGLRDLDGRLQAFMAAQAWRAMIVRPDYYVYGGVADLNQVEQLATDLLRDLQHAGSSVAAGEAAVEVKAPG